MRDRIKTLSGFDAILFLLKPPAPHFERLILKETLIKSSAKIAPSDFAANWTKEPPEY